MDIIVLRQSAKQDEIDNIQKRLEAKGLSINLSKGTERTIIGVIGDTSKISEEEVDSVRAMPGVDDVMRIVKPYKLASRDFKKANTVIDVDGLKIGQKKIHIIAGPCAIEGRDILLTIAEKVKACGASFIRGGAFKPRTSPYTFQGMGEEGLQILLEAKKLTGMPIVTELMDPRDLTLMLQYTDIIQIGTRNMQNFRLLLEVGMVDKPVLLKRGLAATIKEWLMAAEYIMSRGNHKVILCERGIRTFETTTRNTLDLSAIPVLKQLTHLPIIVDPSHAVGRWDLVKPMALAAVAAGADGLLVEVHTKPEEACSDGEQSLKPDVFDDMVKSLRLVAAAVGREI
ncbi:MAG: 3-deoxy-7-phosphoheptulonate synthase [Candidatus Magnetominusculus sp. LBB02]|nr:3-deoxy-7-phosphoheptulonate synthase [Candidatus Magnetominusculus sp. LBB02]